MTDEKMQQILQAARKLSETVAKFNNPDLKVSELQGLFVELGVMNELYLKAVSSYNGYLDEKV